MAKLSEFAKFTAQQIMVAVIQGRCTKGLDPNTMLVYPQIAGEAVEAALALESKIRGEEEFGEVSNVVKLQNAFRLGWSYAQRGLEAEDLPTMATDEEHEEAYRGLRAAYQAAKTVQ